MSFRSVLFRCRTRRLTRIGLAAFALLLPSGLSGQAGLEGWYGTRSYHGGLRLEESERPTYEAFGVAEYGLDLHLLTVGRTRFMVGVNLFDAGFGLDGPSQHIGFKHKISGYGARLGIAEPLLHFGRGAEIALRATIGAEVFSLADSPDETRMAFTAGPELGVPLSSRFRLDLRALVGTTATSPYSNTPIPGDLTVTSTLPWWNSFQLGLEWSFHSR